MSDEYKTTAVLCSGGLDSAVLVAERAREGPVVPIYVSVGFAWEAEERRMMARLFAAPPLAGAVAPPVELSFDMRDVFAADHWAMAGKPPAFDTPDEDVYLPGRNVILLSKAATWLATRRVPVPVRLCMGQLGGNPFPDATPVFLAAMASALSLGLAMPLAIETPFIAMDKADVIRRGVELGVPLDLTLSCMQPRDGLHCGGCSKCRERRDGFAEAGVNDPTRYARTPVR
jgi:7-cyano-7-deazaguanine synthase